MAIKLHKIPHTNKIILNYAESDYKKVKKVIKQRKDVYIATRVAYYISILDSFSELKNKFPSLFHSIPIQGNNTIKDIIIAHANLERIIKIIKN